MHFSVTKKLPKVLSRLNEINGGCEKNLHLPVLGFFFSFQFGIFHLFTYVYITSQCY